MHLQTQLAAVLVTLAATVSLTSSAQDMTRTDNAVGPEVVEAVVDEVRRSCVFPQDAMLLRRLAYVESRDGSDPDTFRTGFYGGIWQVTEAMYNRTKTSPGLQSTRAALPALLDWSLTRWPDLVKPLYSGLAAALYVQDTLGADTPHPAGIPEQEEYWEKVYHQGGGGGGGGRFSSRAALMQQGCQSDPHLDLVFAVDTSSSISRQDFAHAKDFVVNTTRAFDLRHGLTRVALVTFADVARVAVAWDRATTAETLDALISHEGYEGGGTETARALDLVTSLFTSSGRSSAVKVLVVITDGRPHDIIDTSAATSRLIDAVPGVLVLAVGVGDEVDRAELQRMASAPACRHVFKVASYRQIDAVREEIQRLTCTAPLALDIGETVRCTVGHCPPFLIQLPANTGISMTGNTTCTAPVDVFVSSTAPYPSSAQFDRTVTLPSSAASFALNARSPALSPAHMYVKVDQTPSGSLAGHCVVTLAVAGDVTTTSSTSATLTTLYSTTRPESRSSPTSPPSISSEPTRPTPSRAPTSTAPQPSPTPSQPPEWLTKETETPTTPQPSPTPSQPPEWLTKETETSTTDPTSGWLYKQTATPTIAQSSGWPYGHTSRTETALSSTPTPPAGSQVPAGTASLSAPNSQCIQCGNYSNGTPCTNVELVLTGPTSCDVTASHFCMTDVIADSSSRVATFKRCVDRHTCHNDWYLQTSDRTACLTFDPSGAPSNVACHFCCLGDGCNTRVVPAYNTQWRP